MSGHEQQAHPWWEQLAEDDNESDDSYDDSSDEDSEQESDSDTNVNMPMPMDGQREVRISLTPLTPSSWPRLPGQDGEWDDDPLGPIRALDIPLLLVENIATDGGQTGLGVKWVWSTAETFGRIIEAINACRLAGIAIDAGIYYTDQETWKVDALNLFMSTLVQPRLRWLDLGTTSMLSPMLSSGLQRILARSPALKHATVPDMPRPNYGAFWGPVLADSWHMGICTLCTHGARGRETIAEPADSIWCYCHEEKDARNEWPKKWSATLHRNRFINAAVRQAAFSTMAIAKLLLNAQPNSPGGGKSLLDLPPELLAIVASTASTSSWAVSEHQGLRLATFGANNDKMRALANSIASIRDTTAQEEARDLWLRDNGINYEGTVEEAMQRFEAQPKRPAARRRRR